MENLKLNPEAPIPELFMAIQNKINEIIDTINNELTSMPIE